jgi:hypothetical protein
MMMMVMMTTRTATSNQMKMSPRSSENPTNRITKPQEGAHASQLRPAQNLPPARKTRARSEPLPLNFGAQPICSALLAACLCGTQVRHLPSSKAVAFKKPIVQTTVPESPDRLFRDLPRRKHARSQSSGYKRFDRAAEAVRFAIEDLPPEQLLRAHLQVDESRFDGVGIRRLYNATAFPLARRDPSSPL